MSGKVFANGREVVSGGGGHGKVTSAFPDVCNSPPGPPSGPLPVPYADSSNTGGLKQGSKQVEIGGKPVGLSDKSFYKCSPLGNEAATKNFGANLVTHAVTGKTQFGSWSHDVKIEGQGVLRHRDLTTSNNGSYPGGTPPFVNLSSQQKLALDRIAQKACPCCGDTGCPAAFKEGEEPLSMKEYYGIQPPGLPNPSARTQEYQLIRQLRKKQHCKCVTQTRVLPTPPCDVFRRSDPDRTRKVEEAWNADRHNYVEDYEKQTGRNLYDYSHFLNNLISCHPPAEQIEIRKAAKLRKADMKQSKWGKLWMQHHTEATQLARINHLVPKEAGGCPTNPDNLQPQQVLCDTCQAIDQMMTDHWQG
ncbi:MAG TPA: PAAR-like domain-containing protein [Enhygromyxa sp.]|nr:PAAR-like domain-containing protein [Enhygromyxa sp.]